MTLILFSRSLHYKDCKSEPYVHSTSWINRWNLTKLAQIHHCDGGKKWLDFGDLDLIFKVTPALWNSNFDRKKLVCTLSLEPMARIWPTSTDTSIGRGKKWLDFGDLDLIFKFSRSLHYKMSLVCNECVCVCGGGWYLISIAYYLFSFGTSVVNHLLFYVKENQIPPTYFYTPGIRSI